MRSVIPNFAINTIDAPSLSSLSQERDFNPALFSLERRAGDIACFPQGGQDL
jgi:hypothetical protein